MKKRRHTHRRGRTRAQRMRLLDQFISCPDFSLASSNKSTAGDEHQQAFLAIDVGFGDSIASTVALGHSLLSALSSAKSKLRVFAVEADIARCEHARLELNQLLSDANEVGPIIEVQHGGFDLSALGLKNAQLVRCFNVLRGYALEDVAHAQRLLLAALGCDGLLFEGSSDTEGHLLCSHIWRNLGSAQRRYEGLLFASDFQRGFSPRMFRDVLPRDLRRHFFSPEPVFEWLNAWEQEVSHLRKGNITEPSHAQFFQLSLKELAPKHRFSVYFFDEAGKLQERADTDTQSAAVLWTPLSPSSRPEVLASTEGNEALGSEES